MKIFKLASVVALLILFASPDLILMGGLSRAGFNIGDNVPQMDGPSDYSQRVMDQSLALFMPEGYQVATEVVTPTVGGC